jgi:hypothetical protein
MTDYWYGWRLIGAWIVAILKAYLVVFGGAWIACHVWDFCKGMMP